MQLCTAERLITLLEQRSLSYLRLFFVIGQTKEPDTNIRYSRKKITVVLQSHNYCNKLENKSKNKINNFAAIIKCCLFSPYVKKKRNKRKKSDIAKAAKQEDLESNFFKGQPYRHNVFSQAFCFLCILSMANHCKFSTDLVARQGNVKTSLFFLQHPITRVLNKHSKIK